MIKDYIPEGEKVLVSPIEKSIEKVGSIFSIVLQAKEISTAKVLIKGNGITEDLEIGDIVYYPTDRAKEFEIEGEQCLLLEQKDILLRQR